MGEAPQGRGGGEVPAGRHWEGSAGRQSAADRVQRRSATEGADITMAKWTTVLCLLVCLTQASGHSQGKYQFTNLQQLNIIKTN